jgi:hypothetical protein
MKRNAKFVEITEGLPKNPGETIIHTNRFSIGCPCGEGHIIGIRFAETELDKGVCWAWNNDRAKPTLTPSIQVVGCCAWHGHLIDGEYIEC